MKRLLLLLSAALCTQCALTPDVVERATPGAGRAVVFDIDGTLTQDVKAIGSIREGAVEAVDLFAEAGYRIIYLSARHPLFQWQIPGWLERHGFPAGSVQLTQSRRHRSDHARFKHGVLGEYVAKGWTLAAAYGDSSTDFEAYARAGVDPDRVFALRREGADHCEPGPWAACFAGWPEQMLLIRDLATREAGHGTKP